MSRIRISLLCLQILVVGLLVCIVGFYQAVPAHAYSLWNEFWPNNYDIIYHLNSMTSKDTNASKNAVYAWNSSAAPVTLYSGSSSTEILVEDGNYGKTGYDGLENNNVSYTCTHNGYSAIVASFVYLNTYYTNGYSNGAAQSVAAHELGHALGLGDVYYTSPKAVMNGTTPVRWGQEGVDTPQQDDVNGTDAIYFATC